MKKVFHFALNELSGLRLVGQPDKSEMQGAVGEDVAVLSPRLAQLSLGAVAVNGMFEMALGHREEHLSRSCFSYPINHTERKGREGSVSARKQSFNSFAATETFLLWEKVSLRNHFFFLFCSSI